MEKDYKSLDNFLKLCRKAQEMIFDTLTGEIKYNYFQIFGSIDDDIVNLTPIEQIFDIGAKIKFIRDYRVPLTMFSQAEVFANNKRYVVDFLIDGYDIWDKNLQMSVRYSLKKRLIIELDGKDYHSSKEQMNYDYQRENDLKLAGYDIMRFTGSQIFTDVFGCLDKVYEYIKLAEKRRIYYGRK